MKAGQSPGAVKQFILDNIRKEARKLAGALGDELPHIIQRVASPAIWGSLEQMTNASKQKRRMKDLFVSHVYQTAHDLIWAGSSDIGDAVPSKLQVTSSFLSHYLTCKFGCRLPGSAVFVQLRCICLL